MAERALFGGHRTDEPEHTRPSGVVTRREAQVLSLVTTHYGNAEIGQLLNISKRTVESHMAALLRKFAVADRPALIRAATSPPRAVAARPGTHVKPPFEPNARYPSRVRSTALDERIRRREQLHQRRAVALMARLRNSIKRHEALAVHLDRSAARWRDRAFHAYDDAARLVALRYAATARQEADWARSRAIRSGQLLDQVIARLPGDPSGEGPIGTVENSDAAPTGDSRDLSG